ncbi:MAG TPA: hypothetical protein VK338_06310 [Candidatus Nitrosocosmicus sp.]|nr:hypothetical protein [Candidatus Nitrosocosmicus sp.]
MISLANDKEYIWIIVEVDMYDHGNMGVHVECLAARAHGAPDIVLAQFLTDLTDVYLHVREEAKSTYRVRWNEIARKYPHLNI